MENRSGEGGEAAGELEAKVACLKQAACYPEEPAHVEAIETHMAWVFLTEAYAYKLKKPVRYSFLDLSTLEARRWDCEEEVRLNRRLAGDVYLGVVPLARGEGGAMRVAGAGAPVDWLVRMRRLPKDRMLTYRLKTSTVRPEEVRAVARVLARFYRQAEPVRMEPGAYRARLERELRSYPDAMEDSGYDVPVSLGAQVAAALLAFLARHPDLFEARVRAGRLVEAHGDLRPEHVCLTPEPVIFDALEFDRTLRILDTASELAFLAMECEYLDAAPVGDLLFETYAETTGDRPPEALIHFYKGYWAARRANLAVQHSRPPDEYPSKWSDQAHGYLALARSHIRHLE